jgi:hypothetical protein
MAQACEETGDLLIDGSAVPHQLILKLLNTMCVLPLPCGALLILGSGDTPRCLDD